MSINLPPELNSYGRYILSFEELALVPDGIYILCFQDHRDCSAQFVVGLVDGCFCFLGTSAREPAKKFLAYPDGSLAKSVVLWSLAETRVRPVSETEFSPEARAAISWLFSPRASNCTCKQARDYIRTAYGEDAEKELQAIIASFK